MTTPTNEELNEIYNYLRWKYPNVAIDVYFDKSDKTIYTKVYLDKVFKEIEENNV